MDTVEYHKLVRDKMPEIIKQDGWTPIIRILPEDEYKKELEKKLYEEYQEVLSATGEKRIEELSDMLEVMISLAGLEGKTLEDIVETAIGKDGRNPVTRILSEDEYEKELEKKLYEEYQEMLSVTGEKRIEGLLDMLETMMSLARLEDKTLEDVVETSKVKKLKRGGFDKKIFLEKEIKEEK